MTDTIFALSSGAVPAAIAVIRVSGRDAFAITRRLTDTLPAPRRAALRAVRDPDSGELLDRGLAICFPGPASVTGEDLAELHLHGSRAIVRAVSAALARLGARAAEAGEFTRRALMAGRVDMTEIEGLADLLAAETEMQRRAALRSTEGALRQRVADWQQRLLDISAQVEADIEFAEDHDLDAAIDCKAAIAPLHAEMEEATRQPGVERLNDGVRVVLAGPPNAGKSTLFNALAARDAAIVSAVAGTTRDRIEAAVTRDGVAYLLVDTAGITETADTVEAIGVERARQAMDEADILLWLGDEAPPRPDALLIHPRADIVGRHVVPRGRIGVSAQNDLGMVNVWDAIAGVAATMMIDVPLPLNARQRTIVSRAVQSLEIAMETGDSLIAAEELRVARRGLTEITGTDANDVLDIVFSRFCVGK